jgi:hypothetical protein
MVEFALVTPIILFLFFAVLEGSLLIFAVGTFRYAGAHGVTVDADAGNATDADTQAVTSIRTGPVGTTNLASVTEIDVQCETASLTPCASYSAPNRYLLSGTALAVPWPPAIRNVHNGQSDFLGLTIKYQYQWKSGSLIGASPLQLTETYHARVEPQIY